MNSFIKCITRKQLPQCEEIFPNGIPCWKTKSKKRGRKDPVPEKEKEKKQKRNTQQNIEQRGLEATEEGQEYFEGMEKEEFIVVAKPGD